MCRVAGIVFFLSWIVCGSSIEAFFEGGAPLVIISLLVAIACAMVLGSKRD